MPENILKKFLVTGRNPHNSFVTEMKIVYPQVKKSIDQILALLFPYFSERKKRLVEITIDFIKSDKN